MIDLGKGTLIADSEEEAIWWHQAEEGKDYIKQIKGSIRKSQDEFMRGCKANIKQKKLTLNVQKEFLKFCETKIKR